MAVSGSFPGHLWAAFHGRLHSFTYESKLHLWNRGVQDINHSELFHRERRLAPTPHGQLLGASVDPAAAEKMAKIWRSGR